MNIDTIKAGSTLRFPVYLNVEKEYNEVIFTCRSENGEVTKTLTSDVDGVFILDFTQEETILLKGHMRIEAQVNYADLSVSKSNIKTVYVNDTLATKLIANNAPTDDSISIILDVIKGDVAVIITPKSSAELIEAVTALFQATKTEADTVYEAYRSGELKGDKGDTGETGPQGPKGNKGDTGLQGPKGDKGDTGATGPQGPRGYQGEKGDKGDKGDTGATGATGATGPQGEKGSKGDKGDTGAQGPKGDKGDKGDQGLQGPKGDTGATGPQGPQGIQGETGPQGPQGEPGQDADMTKLSKLWFYDGSTPPTTLGTFSELKEGDVCYCYATVHNAFNGFYVCSAITSQAVSWKPLSTMSATGGQCRAGSTTDREITPNNQHQSVFYGLAKASGDTTQANADTSLYPVGTYTDDAKEAIQQMLGIVTLTQLEYDALITKSPSTIYIITEG